MKPWMDSSYLVRYILLNTVDLSDYRIFPARVVHNAPPFYDFPPIENGARLPAELDKAIPIQGGGPQAATLDQFLERNGTVAFLLIKNDKLVFERYYNGYDHSSTCTSFSAAKSFVSALIGIAVHEGLIDRLDDPITKYLPELAAPHWHAITIRHLVGMTSGLKYQAGFLPWDDDPRIYYTPDLRQLAKRVGPAERPGVRFRYNNYNLVLLGILLERVTRGTVCAYLEEKIWKPLGMEYPASWSLDSQRCGMEKMESGLNARAIDFAKFGRLYLQHGEWNGRQVVPANWVVESTTVEANADWTNYKYLWWIPRSGKGRFMAVGNLGQFIYVAPDKDCVMLRFGRGKPKDWQMAYPKLFASLADLL